MPLSQLAVTVRMVPSNTTLAEAARIMIRDSIGTLLIREEKGGPVEGILTDRDLVKEIAAGQDPKATTVAGYKGRRVTMLPEGSSRREITEKMRVHGVRRIPLTDGDGHVTRIVSLDDLLTALGEEMSDVAAAIRVGFRAEAPEPDPDR